MQSALQHRRLKRSIKVPRQYHRKSHASENPTSSDSSVPQLQDSEQELAQHSEQDPEAKKREEDKEKNSYIVDFEGELDPQHPRNWSWPYKLLCTFLIFNLVFVTGWASAADSSALYRASARFHVSPVVETLDTAVYL